MTDGPGFCTAGLKKASKKRVTHRQFLKVRGGTSGLPRPIPPSLDQMVCTVVFFAISSIEHRSSSIAALRGTPLTLRCSISSSVDNSMCSFVKVKAPPPPRLKAISYGTHESHESDEFQDLESAQWRQCSCCLSSLRLDWSDIKQCNKGPFMKQKPQKIINKRGDSSSNKNEK